MTIIATLYNGKNGTHFLDRLLTIMELETIVVNKTSENGVIPIYNLIPQNIKLNKFSIKTIGNVLSAWGVFNNTPYWYTVVLNFINGWHNEKELIYQILPIESVMEIENDEYNLLYTALSTAPNEVLIDFINWAKNIKEERFPNPKESLRYLSEKYC